MQRESGTMAISQQDVMEDLAYMEAEGPADMLEDEAEFADGLEDYGEDDAWDNADLGDDFEEYDGMEADEAEESISQTLGNLLGAEEEDEFLGSLWRGAKSLVQKAAPIVGKIARGAAPILSMIPHPAAQAASRIANVVGKLRAEGASVEDALEAVAEVAARDPRALPVVAGLAARSVIKNRGASMSPAQRHQVARTMTRAARNLVQRGGPQAIRALPKITKSVKRTAAARGTPVGTRPHVVARTAAKVAQNPQMLRRLSAPSANGVAMMRRNGTSYGNGRTLRVAGPATITIHVG
jgi:hypothetical protein